MCEWPSYPLEELTDPTSPITYGVVKPGEADPNGILFVRGGDITDGRIDETTLRTITAAVSAQYHRTLLRGGEIVVSLVGNPGQVAIVPSSLAGANIARQVGLVRLRDGVDARFVKYYLASAAGQQALGARSLGSVQQVINLRDLRTVLVPQPSSGEQQLIGEVLGALDDKIELNRRTSETLQDLSRALFARSFGDGQGTDWPTRAIGDCVQVTGGSTPSTSEPTFWEGGSHHWVTPKDLSRLSTPVLLTTERAVTDAGLARISSGLLPRGTVLLSSRAPIGYLAINEVPVAVNQGFIAIRPTDALPNVFLLRWLEQQHDAIIARANGSTFLEINKASFRAIPIAVPPQALIDEFMTLAAPLHARLVTAERESLTLAELRDTLLPRLLSGELRIRDAEREVALAT